MILTALNRLYERLEDDEGVEIPPFGFAMAPIHFCLVLGPTGELRQVFDLRGREGKKPTPKPLMVPQPKKRTQAIDPNFMWDHSGYVLGADGKGKPERTAKAHAAFKRLITEVAGGLEDQGVRAVRLFLESWNPETATAWEDWEDKAGANFVFRLDGQNQYVHERPAVRRAWSSYLAGQGSETRGECLVLGGERPLAKLHPSIKGVRGAQVMGASIISFNLDSFCSYGKQQSFNAPTSEEAAFNYTTALNHLLGREHGQMVSVGGSQRRYRGRKVLIGDTSVVFWSEKPTILEDTFADLIEGGLETGMEAGEEGEGASQHKDSLKAVRLQLEAARDGKKPEAEEAKTPFYVLGLAPNASRLSVRFWYESTVGEMMVNLAQHFEDLEIVKSFDNEPDYPAVWMLLKETAVLGKSENIPAVLVGAVMRAILEGGPYPRSLLGAVITRIRADHNVNYLRAAIIKACIVRNQRLTGEKEMEVTMSLNTETKNTAYRLGRLFAVLEKAQKEAQPGINATIKDRSFGAASATPRAVFPGLLRLVQHHIGKLDYGYAHDNRIQEIVWEINEFPAHLSLEEQGLFTLGYYHQRKDFYTKKDKNGKEGEE